jgi:predicted DsbA family dithiol-disulfide isomerase
MTSAGATTVADVRIEYFTDPLCCWSWAFESVHRELRQRHGERVDWSIVLGGMIETWNTYRDPLNDVAAPAQLAPLWHLAGRATGVSIDPAIWHLDPPASSYPASVAVKAAGLQGRAAGEAYLFLAREAVMTRRLNIANRDVLLALGGELAASADCPFDADRFEKDVTGTDAIEAFRSDLQRARFLRIGRFPTLIAHGACGSRIAVGYRPADVLERMLAAVSHGTP